MKDRIKSYMDYKGITAGELSLALDVQRSNISHILNGRNMPGAAFIEKLLLSFQLSGTLKEDKTTVKLTKF